ncbi:Ig-like domain repeat protein [Streptosporangium sp. CA-135522]|uniref:Ig-like domain repeat protein n=1 Tax=Streptosporangium sp. CA-135522 TaxID=3240072 RepID=UPI003D89E337
MDAGHGRRLERAGRRLRAVRERGGRPVHRRLCGLVELHARTHRAQDRRLRGLPGDVRRQGHRHNYYWWNLGGWNNTQSAIEKSVNGAKSSIATSNTTIETGRDYHVKIQVAGRKITAWLDGQKVNEFVDDSSAVQPLYQVVSKDAASGDVVLKVVNAQDSAVRSKVDLGAARIADKALVTSLTASSPADVNSLAEPTKVAPVEQTVTGLGSSFTYDFPAGSVTFIRLGKDGRATASIEAKASPPQVKQGKKVKVHVAVKGGPGTASGQVTVTEGPAVLGEATMNDDGETKVDLSRDLPTGSHTLTVSYRGDGKFSPASSTITLVVKPA